MTIDTATIAFMQSIQNPLLTELSKFIAVAFDPIVLIVMTLLISTYLYLKKEKKQAIFFTSIILITAILIKLLKAVFHRARPISVLIQETGFSLPSGHVTMAVVFFGLVVYLFAKKRTTLIVTPIVIVIALSRLYLQVHWLTDIIVAFILGGIILVSAILYNK